MFGRRPDIQIIQDRKFAIDGHHELLQFRDRDPETDAADATTLLKCEHDPLFHRCANVIMFAKEVDDERERGRMCQHSSYRRAACTNEAKTQMGSRTEYEVSPSLANVGELVPPAFAVPFASLQVRRRLSFGDLIQESRSIEIKYVEKRVIVKVVDKCPASSSDSEAVDQTKQEQEAWHTLRVAHDESNVRFGQVVR